jgi:hypothetical protein
MDFNQRDKGHDIAELVGGPLDGMLVIAFMDIQSYNGEAYKRSFRQSPQHYEFYCYDHIGHWSDPKVMKMLNHAWEYFKD